MTKPKTSSVDEKHKPEIESAESGRGESLLDYQLLRYESRYGMTYAVFCGPNGAMAALSKEALQLKLNTLRVLKSLNVSIDVTARRYNVAYKVLSEWPEWPSLQMIDQTTDSSGTR